MLTRRALALLLCAAPALAGEKELVDDDYQVKLSLPTEEDREVWAQPGFRLQLGYSFGGLVGGRPNHSLTLHSASLRPSVRLDRYWSIAGTFTYTVTLGDLQGLRWSATIEPTFHPLRTLAVSLGLGYGGLEVAPQGEVAGLRRDPEPVPRTLLEHHLYQCSGDGLSALARAEYLLVVGPLFATGPYLEAGVQWTRCEEGGDQVDPETGAQAADWQWWLHKGATLGWWMAWR